MKLEERFKNIKNAELDIELLKRRNEDFCRKNIELMKKRNEEFCKKNDLVINGLQEEIRIASMELKEELEHSKRKRLDCKPGYCGFRDMQDVWVYSEDTVDEIFRSYPREANKYIKVDIVLIKTNVKIAVESGKIKLASVTVKKQKPKFYYKTR